MTSKAQATKQTWTLFIVSNYKASIKEKLMEWTQHIEYEKIFVNYISDKRLISKKIQNNSITRKHPMKNEQKD
jgi:hypothetical protein